MADEVRDNRGAGRYELVRDGEVIGFAPYREADGVVVVPHSEVTPSLRGQGLGAVLVSGLLDDLRARGLRVVPQCWYVAGFIDDHPQYRDLLAPAVSLRHPAHAVRTDRRNRG